MSKKDWRDYPENYFKVIEKFQETGEDVVLTETYATLSYVRHSFHRFIKALSAAGRSGDRYAADLANVTRDMFLVLEPVHALREAPATLTFKVNPMTKAILKHNTPGDKL